MPKGGKIIAFNFPLKGLDTGLSNTAQRKGTTRDQLNCLPWDATQARARGGQRAGVSKLFATQLSSGNRITALHQVTTSVSGTGSTVVWAADIPSLSAGSLTGQDNWLAFGGDPAWVVGALGLESDIDLRANRQITGLAGWDHTAAFEVQFTMRATTGAAAVTKYLQIFLTDAGGATRWLLDCTETVTGVWMLTLSNPTDPDVTVFGQALARGADHTLSFAFDGIGTCSIKVEGVVVGSGTCGAAAAGDLRLLVIGGQTSTTVNGGFMYLRDLDVLATTSAEPSRGNYLVVTTNSDIYLGTTSGVTAIDVAALNGHKPTITDLFAKAYVVDGTSTKEIDVLAGTSTNLVATSGTVPAGCRIAVVWRGRLVLAAPDTNPQNIFMSRNGDPKDWLYGQTDELSAVELNASNAGRVGQPVMALVPWHDDVLVIGTDHAIYALEGDPAASSGQLVTISESIGILQHQATCISPENEIYFVGTGGFFKMTAGGAPTNISKGRLDQFFANINRKTCYVELQYDRDRNQVWIFVTLIASGASTHLVYDVRTDGFWQQQMPDTVGPIGTLVYDGDGPFDRFTLLGGRDGYLRKLDQAAVDDDGVAISSYCFIGPVQPAGDFDEFMVTQWQLLTGVGTTGLKLDVYAGASAQDAAAAAAVNLGTYTTAGRQAAGTYTRFRANCYFVKLSNSADFKTWNLETLQAAGEAGGQLRG